jgi:hypothetical protein
MRTRMSALREGLLLPLYLERSRGKENHRRRFQEIEGLRVISTFRKMMMGCDCTVVMRVLRRPFHRR